MLSIMRDLFYHTDKDVLSQRLTNLRPEGTLSYESASPLVCIGQWLYMSDDETSFRIENIFVSKSGHIIFILASHPDSTSLPKIISSLSTVTVDTLDCIASEYFFRTCGQSYLVRDIMVKHGHWSFDTATANEQKIRDCLSSKSFSLFCVDE